ncbi:nucleotidyltransferase domain-containing protein [Halococcus agarilyticus]|uniref:nucleotidyltransferase domain-containing protein n=1 Tax=Halococcus agarilyticus TaxID=1232219 RepID=UPI000677810A|nr:hypothetical protein [Halococcus agarilyticus]
MATQTLPPDFLAALETLCDRLDDTEVTWAVTASTNLALRGIPVEPGDIDVMTDGPGAEVIERRLEEYVESGVARSRSVEHRIASDFGMLDIGGVRVEIMGDVEHLVDGEWVSTADIATNREFVGVDGHDVPVMALEREREGYRELGRDQRAELVDAHCGGET